MRIPLRKMHRRFQRRHLAGRLFSSWSLFLLTMMILVLLAASMAYYASAVSSMWRVVEDKQEAYSTLDVIVDAEHVLYVGNERKIVPLDGVLKAVLAQMQQVSQQGGKRPVLFVRIAGNVKANMLLPLLYELSGFPLRVVLWEEDVL